MINRSWSDVTKQYLPWLSRVTHEPYRLLTEAEWDYAARADSQGKYTWGDEIRSNQQIAMVVVASVGDTEVRRGPTRIADI